MNDSNSIERLISFVDNLEEKLSSIKRIQENFSHLINILSNTHENITQELTIIKTILYQQKSNEEEIIPIDQNPSQWDEDDEQIPISLDFQSKSERNLDSNSERQIDRLSINPVDRVSLYSASSFESSSETNSLNNENRPNSSTSKRSSNLKKSAQSSTRVKSPKSVTFYIDQTKDSSINQEIIEQSSNQSYSPPNSDLISNLFEQHHQEVTKKPNIGYKLGNALTNVRIHEIESINGDYLRLLNISNSDDYDLTGHFLQQNIACVPVSRFKFPSNTIIRAGQTITIWCGSVTDIEPQPPHVFRWKEQKRWETGAECVTILAKPTGQAIAWARSSNRVNSDQSSSDILFVHSKCHFGPSDVNSVTQNSFKNRSRLSTFNFIGNNKPPFAHSPSSPIHPDHNGGNSHLPNDLRSQIIQKGGGSSQLLNRPKSSPFSSHIGCKKDLISMNFLRNEQRSEHQQNTLKT